MTKGAAKTRRLTRRQRARAIRAAQYAVLVVAVGAFAALANWDRITEAFFDSEIIRELFPDVITVALKNTVLYTLCAFGFGLVLGLVIALMRLSQVAAYRALATVYVEFFRGVPALLVLIAFGYGIPVALNTEVPGGVLGTITVALGLVAAAYIAETVRAGIQAVPKGQTEAARSLGMSHTRAMISIVIPQAFRIVLPPLTNELIILTKDSSLVYLLGVTLPTRELAKFGRDALNEYVSMTPILIAGLAYLIITVPLGFVVRRLEAEQAKAR
jgi:polar amino acid transport system permease protein